MCFLLLLSCLAILDPSVLGLYPANVNVRSIREPNIFVLINVKLSFHLQHINTPHLLDVVAHFEALLEAVHLIEVVAE